MQVLGSPPFPALLSEQERLPSVTAAPAAVCAHHILALRGMGSCVLLFLFFPLEAAEAGSVLCSALSSAHPGAAPAAAPCPGSAMLRAPFPQVGSCGYYHVFNLGFPAFLAPSGCKILQSKEVVI